ncbi:hypothetical protein ADUPG1_013624 [Aduncisulcus paluster]|uniref:Uncharacterized protein n=1 Tax=Aduncisulcus paluster TaxID=2918883 RepID=A0ABQ5K8C8_9EUKA|nr:hypothetical protein ADUPG1_013624 [Aduncisulcus paluster]
MWFCILELYFPKKEGVPNPALKIIYEKFSYSDPDIRKKVRKEIVPLLKLLFVSYAIEISEDDLYQLYDHSLKSLLCCSSKTHTSLRPLFQALPRPRPPPKENGVRKCISNARTRTSYSKKVTKGKKRRRAWNVMLFNILTSWRKRIPEKDCKAVASSEEFKKFSLRDFEAFLSVVLVQLDQTIRSLLPKQKYWLKKLFDDLSGLRCPPPPSSPSSSSSFSSSSSSFSSSSSSFSSSSSSFSSSSSYSSSPIDVEFIDTDNVPPHYLPGPLSSFLDRAPSPRGPSSFNYEDSDDSELDIKKEIYEDEKEL